MENQVKEVFEWLSSLFSYLLLLYLSSVIIYSMFILESAYVYNIFLFCILHP